MAAQTELEVQTETDIIQGSKLVVRMQYDDAIVVSQKNLDDLLSTIVQSMKDNSLLEYKVTLGARVNPGVSQDTSQLRGTDTPQACQTQSSCAAGGISAIGSTPAENYNYYAKTAAVMNTDGAHSSTILVEIFVNYKIKPSDSSIEKLIISFVTKSINSCIVKQQKKPAAVSICVLKFVSSPN